MNKGKTALIILQTVIPAILLFVSHFFASKVFDLTDGSFFEIWNGAVSVGLLVISFVTVIAVTIKIYEDNKEY